jgi:coenzyme F420-0:L-glutamate ligase/coenzyme F420-1:gamma-L-glutamate ligase
MAEPSMQLFALHGVGEVSPGDDLAAILASALGAVGAPGLLDGDVLVVTSKVVAKAEGRLERLDGDVASAKAAIVDRESVRVLRRRGDLVVSETSHGYVCANAGVDLSNVEDGVAVLLPVDADRSARRLRADLRRLMGVDVGVVISDTFGRAWRRGVADVALGCAGVVAILDLRGTPDAMGRILEATEVCIADELASAAELVAGKAAGVPAVVIRGVSPAFLGAGSIRDDVVRPPSEDLFR